MNKFDLNNFVVDKVVSHVWRYSVCPKCGWNQEENTLDLCPMCGENLVIEKWTEIKK